MESDILQQFLDRNLLNLGEEPDRLAWVKKAADEVAETLRTNRRSLLRSASVLLGEHLGGDPIVGLCEQAIKQQWPTYRSRFQNDTNQLYRAVLLQAVSQVTDDPNCSYAAIVLYAASSPLPYITAEREDELFRTFLRGLVDRVEAEAAKVWAPPTAGCLSESKFPEDGVKIAAVDTERLAEALQAAVGPKADEAATTAINEALAAALSDVATKIITQARADDAKIVARIGGALGQVGFSDNLRAHLLYWKEALYSPAKIISYRHLSPDAAVYWTAHDLHRQIPSFHPHSVEFFLRETLRAALGDALAGEELTIEQFCAVLSRELTPGGPMPRVVDDERLTLLAATESVTGQHFAADKVADRMGVPVDAQVPREEFAVWLFRDLQARRLVELS